MRVIGLLAIGLALAGCAKSFDEWRRDLRDDDPYVRLMAAVALGRASRPEAVPDLLEALSDAQPDVREAARDSLSALGPAAVPALLEQLRAEALRTDAPDLRLLASVLIDQGLAGVSPLMRALQDERYDGKAILRALGDVGSAAVAPLGELLVQPDPALAAAAADALGSLGPVAAPVTTRLVVALRRPEPEVVQAAAAALGRVAPENDEALAALLQVARDPAHPGARDAALDSAVRGLLRRMAGGEPARQEQALAQMAGLGRDALGGLVQALKFDDEAVAAEAAECLAALGPDVLPLVVSSLGERNPIHIERGALVVRCLGTEAALPALLEMVRDPANPARIRATTALSGLGDDAASAWPLLHGLLDEGQPNLAIAAAYSLGFIRPPDEAALESLITARATKAAMIGKLLLPAIVRGLLERDRLDDLRAIGGDAVAELERTKAGADPQLASRAAAALDALSGR